MAKSRQKTPTPADVRDKGNLSPEEAEKVIPSFQIGRLRRARRADLESYIKRQVEGAD